MSLKPLAQPDGEVFAEASLVDEVGSGRGSLEQVSPQRNAAFDDKRSPKRPERPDRCLRWFKLYQDRLCSRAVQTEPPQRPTSRLRVSNHAWDQRHEDNPAQEPV